MARDDDLRGQLERFLDWGDAHVRFDLAVADIPERFRGMQPAGVPYSPWQLLEHMRLTQRDILQFCRDPDYTEPRWPEDYWPPSASPPSGRAWDESIEGFRRDRDELKRLARDPAVDLHAAIPHGQGQTHLRELLLVTDHTSYHVGQLIVVRRLLGIWESG